MWRQLFQATWKTYKSHFTPLIDDIRGHGDLIQRQATLSQIEDFRRTREVEDLRLKQMLETQESQRLRDLYSWMQSPNVENDQSQFTMIRSRVPDSGRWILDNPSLKDWLHPKFPTIPALLWVNEIPGAGTYYE